MALAEKALHNGYQLQFPPTFFLFEMCCYIDLNFIDRCRTFGVDTSRIRPAFAVYKKDLPLLQSSITPPKPDKEFFKWLLILAAKQAWVPGVKLIATQFAQSRDDVLISIVICSFFDRRGEACREALLGLGQIWLDSAFILAWGTQNFAKVQEVVGKGALRNSPDPSLPNTEYYDREKWLAELHQVLKAAPLGREMRPLWERSASQRRIVYVAALVDQQIAEAVAPDINQWMGVLYSLLRWWTTKAQAYTLEHPSAECNIDIPHALQIILERTGFDLPEVWREAEEVATVIRGWAGVRGPSSTILSLLGVAQDATSTANWLTKNGNAGSRGRSGLDLEDKFCEACKF
jgi:hypothetical protein